MLTDCHQWRRLTIQQEHWSAVQYIGLVTPRGNKHFIYNTFICCCRLHQSSRLQSKERLVMSEAVSASPAEQPSSQPVAATAMPAHETMTYQERRMSGQVAFGYETGRRRTSSFGAYTRVVVIAVDPSDNAKQAFDCESTLHLSFWTLCLKKILSSAATCLRCDARFL